MLEADFSGDTDGLLGSVSMRLKAVDLGSVRMFRTGVCP
jgi:hypothetical protein